MFSAYLVEDISDISLGLSKPHGQQLWPLDGDEVGLTLVSNGLSQQRFTTSRWAIEQHALGWSHAKLEILVGMFHRVLYKLLQLTLDILQATHVVPGHCGHLHRGFTQSTWVALAESPLKCTDNKHSKFINNKLIDDKITSYTFRVKQALR